MKFPDEYFPIPEDFKEDYINKIQSGKEYSKGLKVLFCATCKDVEKTIAKSISNCDFVGSFFKDYQIYLYENNSNDNTVQTIQNLNNDKIILESEFIDSASYIRSNISQQNRCRLIARARNKYVDYVTDKVDYDYIFVFDADIEGGWSLNGIFNSIYYLENDNNIGCMTSYCVLASDKGGDLEEYEPQSWLMFDSFAFRQFSEDWSFPTYNIASHNYIKLDNGTHPLKVNSNFNGLAIYKPKCFYKNYYSVKNYDSDFKTDSEHIAFHKRVWDMGLQVLINPSMITSISNHKYSR